MTERPDWVVEHHSGSVMPDRDRLREFVPFSAPIEIRRLPQPVVELTRGRKILENILFTIYTIGFLLALGLLFGVLTGGIVPLLEMWPH